MATRNKSKNSDTEGQVALFQLDAVPDTFKKAVQIVHSKPKAPMSLLQRKLTNALLRNAVETQRNSEGDWFTIKQSEMLTTIRFNSNNREYLQESALDLMKIVFEWDVVTPDAKKKGMWKASVLFPEIEMLGDIMRYQISSQLRPLVLNPEIYALLDANIIYKFRRGSSTALYEHCIRFVNIGKTTPVQWKEFRDMILGESANAKTYAAYKVFKQKALSPAMAEVNSESDIVIELHETMAGRWIDTLQFSVTRKAPASKQLENIKDEGSLKVIGQMVVIGIPQSEAKRFANTYTVAQIRAALQYTQKRSEDKNASKLENVAAYFRQALVRNWGFSEQISESSSGDTPKRTRTASAAAQLQDAYLQHQFKEANAYFKELDAAEQNGLIDKYNSQQLIVGLRLKTAKPTKGAASAFYRWLAKETWGDPTNDDLLKFAQEMKKKK